MTRRIALPVLALLAVSAPAMAQESGGLRLGPGVGRGPVGLAQPLPFTQPPFLTAHDIQANAMPANRQAQHQDMITRLRGDAGFLAGFSFGTPLAASRQQVQVSSEDGGYEQGRRRHRHRPIIINNEGPLAVTVGNGNVVQQQSANATGPVAQQQVVTLPSGSSGALNAVLPSGNIIQRAPGAGR